jgi:uncharacterized protein YjiK
MKRLGHDKTVILITTGLLLFAAVFIFTYEKEVEEYQAKISADVKIEQTWELPPQLAEVSGIAFFGTNKIACVQDETGKIFIYNLEASRIEKEIEFTGNGDFEGIAIKDDVAFALEASGKLFRIEDFLNTAKVETFNTFFTEENDMEGLFYDESQNRLLLAVKVLDPNSEDQKGIYAAQLPSMEVNKTPVFTLTFEEEIFNEIREEKRGESFFPSEIAVHPESGEIYVLEGREPRLLILDPDGTPKELHRLDKDKFPQPEGLSFDASGKLYISSEGEPGTIHRVTITSN